MNKIGQLFKLVRLGQWVKNGFLFLPIFFDKQLFNARAFEKTFLAALAFACVSSIIYIFNDYRDRNEDRHHPTKKYRPLASGAVSPRQAVAVAIVLAGLAALLLWFLHSWQLVVVLVTYATFNVFYSLGLKHVSLLDVFILAFGYVLRVYAGGFASEIVPSEWLTLMSFLLALFLALAKRRDDLILFENGNKKTRKAIDGYNQAFLNTALSMLGGIMVVAYCMYVLSPETQLRFGSRYLYLTVIFILAGVLRYVQITLVEFKSGSPTTVLYKDKFLQLSIALWLGSLFFIIYLSR
ncbi:decaprenyl-phosphate phosphoribosyltransferase [bacterium]|nr:decaprenyl-phosphate phosphoribosyltransferase [bacterium]